MPRPTGQSIPPKVRMANFRNRMRAEGLRKVEMWLPDTRSPEFIARCQAQARAVAASDPAGDEIMAFIETVYEWPEP